MSIFYYRDKTVYFFKLSAEDNLLIPFVYGWGGCWMQGRHISRLIPQWSGADIFERYKLYFKLAKMTMEKKGMVIIKDAAFKS